MEKHLNELSSEFECLPNGEPIPGIRRARPSNFSDIDYYPENSSPAAEPSARAISRSPTAETSLRASSRSFPDETSLHVRSSNPPARCSSPRPPTINPVSEENNQIEINSLFRVAELSLEFECLPNGEPIPVIHRARPSNFSDNNYFPENSSSPVEPSVRARSRSPIAETSLCANLRTPPAETSLRASLRSPPAETSLRASSRSFPNETSLHVRSRNPSATCHFSRVLGYNIEHIRFVRLISNTNQNLECKIRKYIFPRNKLIHLRGRNMAREPMPTEEKLVLLNTNGDVLAILENNNTILRGIYTQVNENMSDIRVKINTGSRAIQYLTSEERRLLTSPCFSSVLSTSSTSLSPTSASTFPSPTSPTSPTSPFPASSSTSSSPTSPLLSTFPPHTSPAPTSSTPISPLPTAPLTSPATYPHPTSPLTTSTSPPPTSPPATYPSSTYPSTSPTLPPSTSPTSPTTSTRPLLILLLLLL
ncbi:flocculation protein FLO11-like [Belonocnema kinseyi]|uniref:flocculation protein FLO11-like n=1 Tax=Belonocnema kinseyi TaxID=2817044 RepID=UPI00143DFE55|nr:flocculation protein FLO11-like [Belonocnema kinseyi]